MDASKIVFNKNTQTSFKPQAGEKEEIESKNSVDIFPGKNSEKSLKMVESFNENSSIYKSLLQLSQVNSTINSTISSTSHNSLLPVNRMIADEELSAFNLKMVSDFTLLKN